ncbi:hypothetical protein EB796_006770 [Bugula neritina]|uniref:G-protein coupled receptors family 1 profile domain-containing protein n=1 Tax=Bugula neritina TaxID=10212 RepID=A0A7J7KAP8_BUGNE|nr:hypothetical protein EB796_006770 [Bugula neritina]
MDGTGHLDDQESSFLLEMRARYLPVHGYLSLVVCIVGILLNIIIIDILSQKEMLSAVNRLLQAIAAADILTMMTYIPYSFFYYIMHGTEESEERNTRSATCYLVFHVIFSLMSHTISIWLTVTVTLFRYLHIGTQRGRKWCTVQAANLCIGIICVLSLVLYVPHMLVINIKQYSDNSTNFTWYHIDNDGSHYGNYKHLNMTQYVLLAIFVKITPSLLLIGLSGLIINFIVAAHKRYKAMRKNSAVGSELVSLSRDSTFSTYNQQLSLQSVKTRKKRKLMKSLNQRHRDKRAQQITKMILAVAIIFTAVELPQGLISVLCLFVKQFFEKVYWPLGNFLDLITILSCWVNFIILCGMSSQFWQLLAGRFKCLSCSKRSSSEK